ncbi:protein let-653-like [Drosophila subpulchrella]|uniref:protein let-653-like n=1 Tax=Drosophila subpulchrella TaxID=1486046 RepID=UPI0018A13C9E|nr:protein let-653-like [Drosophila subpulchrella]
MQLSIIRVFVLLGFAAVVNSYGTSQPIWMSSKNPESDDNFVQSSSKEVTRNFKQCKPIETTSSEPSEQSTSTNTPGDATSRRIVPLPTLSPKPVETTSSKPSILPSSATSLEDAILRKLVPLPTLAPSSTTSTTELNSGVLNERRIVPLPTLEQTSTASPLEIDSGEDKNGLRRLIPLSTRLLLVFRDKVENVPSTIARKLVPLPTPKPTSTTSTTDVSLENSDQIPDDCEPLPEGLGSRLNGQTLKTLVKTQLG